MSGWRQEAGGVRALHASAVQNVSFLGEILADFGELGADRGVDLLGLLGAGDLAGADGPHRLVGDDANARAVPRAT